MVQTGLIPVTPPQRQQFTDAGYSADFKLAGNKDRYLRFVYSGSGLPTNRETVYWINVQEIPPSAKQENVLQIAIRTRVKLFYRLPR